MDGDKKEIGEIYKKLEATYRKVMTKANEKIKTIEDFIGVGGTYHFLAINVPAKRKSIKSSRSSCNSLSNLLEKVKLMIST